MKSKQEILKLHPMIGRLTPMQWDEIHKAMDGYLNEFKAKQLTLTNVLNSKRFTEVDLLNGYQAGCIEGLDNCCDLGLDDLKKIKEGGKKWVKRYTE